MKIEQIECDINLVSESIRTLKEQLSAFFNALPDPIFIIDSEGKYIESLGGHAEELYSDGSGLKGKNVSEVFSPELSAFFISTIAEVISSNQLKIIEYEMHAWDMLEQADFAPVWFEGRITPIKDPKGKVKAVVWLAINVTQKKILENSLREQSERDQLTGAYNRRYFENSIRSHFAHYLRHKNAFTLAVIDIDFFKKVNDQFGHDTGDEVLKALVDTILAELRTNDLFARYGGEEFILLLPHTKAESALNLMQRLRKRIHNKSIETDQGTVSITISIGLTEISEHDQDYHSIIKRSDDALYMAKKAGRDQVVVAEQ